MSANHARQIVLAARPEGKPRPSDFRLEETAIPTPTPLGGVMPGEAVARVVTTHHDGYSVGEIVLAHTGWRTHALSDCGVSRVAAR